MNLFKETVRLFEFYFKCKVHKLDPEIDKLLQDINLLLSAAYNDGYVDGCEGSLIRVKERMKLFENEEEFQQKVRRTNVQDFFLKTPHIPRGEENK